uniref:Uncharacterized protein n=1 Tax=Fagus sylvatica TaxID=28930 RepID=A0A2N9J6Y9_FAGSY
MFCQREYSLSKNDYSPSLMSGSMHVSCDFGFHKLIIMPPSRPNDSSSWLPKSRDSLPSTKPHSSSQINIRRVASSQVWAMGATP